MNANTMMDGFRFHAERICASMPDEWYESLINLGSTQPQENTMNAAIATLETALENLTENERLHRQAGFVDQADMEVKSAVEIEVALTRLRTFEKPEKSVEDLIAIGAVTINKQASAATKTEGTSLPS